MPEHHPTQQTVTVIGPNLRKQHLGTFHVHAEGCADITRDPQRFGYREVGPHWTITASSLAEIGDTIYEDHIEEGSMQPGEGMGDCHFAPCVKLAADLRPKVSTKRTAKIKADAPDAQAAMNAVVAAVEAGEWQQVADLAKQLEAFGCYVRRTAAAALRNTP